MKTLATNNETIKYGGLGNRFEVNEMIPQLKVMHDNIDPKEQAVNWEDRARLDMIRILIRRCLKILNYINELSK